MVIKRGVYRILLSGFFRNISLTYWIIIANVAFFIIFSIILSVNSKFIDYIALKPSNILQGKALWTLLTHMFMHSGFSHLFFNMFSLFFIGSFIEKIIGRKRFFWLYLLSGIFAGLFLTFLSGFFGFNQLLERIFGNPEIYGVGASGALFGIVGLVAILTPRLKVYLILGPLIAIILQATLLRFLPENTMAFLSIIINLYFLISIFAIISFNPKIRKIALPLEMPFWLLPIIAIVPLVIIGLFVSLPIGNMAHLGGLIVGLAYGYYLKRKYKKKVIMLNRMFVR